MKIFRSILRTLLVISAFSCSEESTTISTQELSNYSKNPLSEVVGEGHNLILRKVLPGLSFQKKDKSAINQIIERASLAHPTAWSATLSISGTFEPINIELIDKIGNSNDVTGIIEQASWSNSLKEITTEMALILLNEPSIDESERSLLDLERKAADVLSEGDLIAFQTGTATARYSIKFWYPVTHGGEGGFDEFINPNILKNDGPDAGQIITADAVGAVGAAASSLVATNGASAAPGPLGIPWAGWVAVIGGAVASINKAL